MSDPAAGTDPKAVVPPNDARRFSLPTINVQAFLVVGLLVVFIAAAYFIVEIFTGVSIADLALQEGHGRIYVDSPEVYTRERLVNDRYEQEYWLRSQMQSLSDTKNLLRTVTAEAVAAGIALGTSSDAAGDARPSLELKSLVEAAAELSFQDEFAVRAGTRDKLRQLLLENMLDDRHDLTGNTVVALKFDTAVIPRIGYQARAFVKVRVKSDSLIPAEIADIAKLAHVKAYYNTSLPEILQNADHPLYRAFSLYLKWIEDIQFRLTSHGEQLLEQREILVSEENSGVRCALPASSVATISDIVATVLGAEPVAVLQAAVPSVGSAELAPQTDQVGEIGQGTVSSPAAYVVHVPRPWSRYLSLTVSRIGSCNPRFSFEASPIWENFVVWPSRGTTQADYSPVSPINDTDTIYAFVGSQDRQYDLLYERAAQTAVVALEANRIRQLCVSDPLADILKCPAGTIRMFEIPSGFFNFIESVIRTDEYSYAMFPKMDASAVLSQNVESGSLQGSAAAFGSASSQLQRSQRASGVASNVIGFGEATTTDEIAFGWVIGDGSPMQASQSAQLALISVPAWTSDLEVAVSTGWLDRSGYESTLSDYDYQVPLPPDYEAFDSFIGDVKTRRQPKIIDDLFSAQKVVACSSGAVLIPGFRLWRSSVVTLGTQRADQISVMPNMRGIIATFDKVSPPVPMKTGDKPQPVPLRVWTSEGVDVSSGRVTIEPPQEVAICVPSSGKALPPS